MKYFCISDVHGFYQLMKDALDSAGFDPANENHTLVLCGDLMDRGENPEECIRYVLSLPRRILICGNHELLMEEAIARQKFYDHDYSNGTVDTALRLTHTTLADVAVERLRDCQLYNQYINELVIWHETKNHIFVHGWIPCNSDDGNKYHSRNVHYRYVQNWRDADIESWTRAMWINGMSAWWQGVREPGKTIVCGHWHVTWARRYIDRTSREWPNTYSTNPEHRKLDWSPWENEGIIALDACTALSHQINVKIIDDEELPEEEL